MRTKFRLASVGGVAIAVLIATAVGVMAGNPAGPGTPPGTTSSYTLASIYDRLDTGAAGSQSTFTEPAAGPGTGTMHTLNEIMAEAPAADNENGATAGDVLAGRTFWGLNVTSGQWGPQTGAAVAGAGTNPAPACWDNANRYVDCGNGTVNDTVTNLLWLKNANCFGTKDYAAANAAAAALKSGDCGLTDNSIAGDWRLPTKAEWEATIERAVALGCDSSAHGWMSLTNTPGTACYDVGPQPFTGVQSYSYWSAFAYADHPGLAWGVYLGFGSMYYYGKTLTYYVWPVRAGD